MHACGPTRAIAGTHRHEVTVFVHACHCDVGGLIRPNRHAPGHDDHFLFAFWQQIVHHCSVILTQQIQVDVTQNAQTVGRQLQQIGRGPLDKPTVNAVCTEMARSCTCNKRSDMQQAQRTCTRAACVLGSDDAAGRWPGPRPCRAWVSNERAGLHCPSAGRWKTRWPHTGVPVRSVDARRPA